jgi:membrane-associated phospholipid phosphatase
MTTESASMSATRSASTMSTDVAGGRPLDHHAALLATAILSGIGFLLLSAIVATGVTQPLDSAARELFRPGDRWGDTQTRFGYMVDGLAPPITAPLLAVGSAIAAWRWRSLRPLLFAGATGCLAVVLTLAAKAVLRRPDGHGDLHGFASSYPSGHLVMLLVCAGTLLLIFAPGPRKLWAALSVVVVLMGVSILVVAMHWLTDLVGSALLGVTVLSVAGLSRSWALGTPAGARS